ncbi:MAG TPA: HD domain-containing protein [Chitinophagaceae bacterium]|nr:HD domain-containing protein [Chitinophagaceae bacterium]
MNPVLEHIRNFADKAHGDQMRRYTDDRYIVHPVRVMEMCSRYTSRLPVLAAALLHDVLEDTSVTRQQLLQFLHTLMPTADATETVKLVIDLTDVYTKAKYPQWNRRKRKDKEAARMGRIHPDAQTIKYADIIDNTPEITREDPDFAKRYVSECKALLRKMTAGHPELYQEALQTVEACKAEIL